MKKSNPLSTYDRVQALVRSPLYLDDLNKLNLTSGKAYIDASELFCQKYGLTFVVTEDFAHKYSRTYLGDTMIFVDVDPVVTIKPAGKLKAYTAVVKVKGKKTKVRSSDPRTHILRDDRFLTLEIDLTRKTADIENRVKAWVRLYKNVVEIDASHSKEGDYDPWEIYDLHENQGLNFSEIARRKSGLVGNPTYNNALRAYDRKVRRAYKKAHQMVDSVSKK